MKFNKNKVRSIEFFINHKRVDNYHKNMLKSIVNNSNNNNLSKSDIEMLPVIIKPYLGLV